MILRNVIEDGSFTQLQSCVVPRKELPTHFKPGDLVLISNQGKLYFLLIAILNNL